MRLLKGDTVVKDSSLGFLFIVIFILFTYFISKDSFKNNMWKQSRKFLNKGERVENKFYQMLSLL